MPPYRLVFTPKSALGTLPTELCRRIIYFLHPADACAVRLVSKKFLPFGTEQAFEIVTLRNGHANVNNKLNKILATEHLREHIRQVTYRSDKASSVAIYTFDSMNRPKKHPSVVSAAPEPDEEDGSSDSETEFVPYLPDNDRGHPPAVISLLEQLARLPRLHKFALVFHTECRGMESELDAQEFFGRCPCRAFQTLWQRHNILEDTFNALSEATGIRVLEIYNLQNLDSKKVATSEPFKTVLKRLEFLRIAFLLEHVCCNTDFDMTGGLDFKYTQEELRSFSQTFTEYWLKPCTGSLKSLLISCTDYWGYWPYMDFTGIHFPKLEKLELCNWAPFHERQIDWIASHGSSLKELYLLNCRIIYAAQACRMDDDGVPRPSFPDADTDRKTFPLRWAKVYTHLRTALQNLTVFKLGGPEMRREQRPNPAEEPAPNNKMLNKLGVLYSRHVPTLSTEMQEFQMFNFDVYPWNETNDYPLEFYLAYDYSAAQEHDYKYLFELPRSFYFPMCRRLEFSKEDRTELDLLVEDVRKRRHKSLGEVL